jgi:hypothetical protein
MSTGLAALIISLAFLVVLLTLGLVLLRGRSSGTVTGAQEAGPVKTSLTITREVRARVDSHLEQVMSSSSVFRLLTTANLDMGAILTPIRTASPRVGQKFGQKFGARPAANRRERPCFQGLSQ